jgi:2-succinyl-5-enolpyruvyl-6-hydroxy-3-cyclohexene-1-carboxylate synthase
VVTPGIPSRYTADLIGGFADAGCTIAFISPGSRNTPLTLMFAHEPRIRDVSIRDERSAAFVALGHAKASGTPAIVVCTSGSAGAHYLPAIVEADHSATPLIVLTADRPARLRGTGAPQTMDQIDLYGSHVKAFMEIDPQAGFGRDDALTLFQAAVRSPAGPVHANVPFDEPLLPPGPITPSTPSAWSIELGEHDVPTDVFRDLEDRKVLIVVGGRASPDLPALISGLAERLAAPVFADPQANLTGTTSLSCGDLIVGGDPPVALTRHRPDVVLRIGPIPTSKPMWQWLESSGVDQILIESSRVTDPLKSARRVVDADPVAVLEANPGPRNSDRSFLEAWLALDAAAERALEAAIARVPFPNEPAIARAMVAGVPGRTTLLVASSRPIRDVDTFASPREAIRVLANRGLNGIDGTISTALGAAMSGSPTALLIGDVAALHDVSALAEVARLGVPLRIVVVNNDGGGIFSFLPQASSPLVDADLYERHWGTPHGLSIARIADAMGMGATVVSSRDAFEAAVASPITAPELIEIATDRETNRGHHESIRDAVALALS